MRKQPGVEEGWLDNLSPRQIASVAPRTKATARGNGAGGGTGSRVRQTALRWVDSSAVPEVHSSSERPLPIRKDAGMCSPSLESLEMRTPPAGSLGHLGLSAAGAATPASREKLEHAHCALPPSPSQQQQQQQQPAVLGQSAASRGRRTSPQRHIVKAPLAFITPPPSRHNSVDSMSMGAASLSVSVSGNSSGGVPPWVPQSPLRVPTLPVPNPAPVQGQRRLTGPGTPATPLSHSTPSNSFSVEVRGRPSVSARNSADESASGDSARTGTTVTTAAAADTAVDTPMLPSLSSKRLSADDTDVEPEHEFQTGRPPALPPFRALPNAIASSGHPPSASAAIVTSDSGNGVASGFPSSATLTSPAPSQAQPSFLAAGAPAPLSPARAAAGSAKTAGVAFRVSHPKRTPGGSTRPSFPTAAAAKFPPQRSQPPPPPPLPTTTTTTTSTATAAASSARRLATGRQRRGNGSGGGAAASTEEGAAGPGCVAPAPASSISGQTASILTSLTSSNGSRFGAGGEWQALPVRRTNATGSPATHAPAPLSPASSLAGGRRIASPNTLALMPNLLPSSSAESPARRGSLGSAAGVHAGLYADLGPRLSPNTTALHGVGPIAGHDLEPMTPPTPQDAGAVYGALRALPKSHAPTLPTGFSRGNAAAAPGGGAVLTGCGVGGGLAGLPLAGISTSTPAALLSAMNSVRVTAAAMSSSHDPSIQTPAVSSAGSLRLTSTSSRPLEANVCAVFSGSGYADGRSSPDLHVLRALPAVRSGATGVALPDSWSATTTVSPSPPQPVTPRRPPAQPLHECPAVAGGGAASALTSPTTVEAPPPFPLSTFSGSPSKLASPNAAAAPGFPAPAGPVFLHAVRESGEFLPLPPHVTPLPPAPASPSPLSGSAGSEDAEHWQPQQQPHQQLWSPTRVALAALLTSLSGASTAAEEPLCGVQHTTHYSTCSASSHNALHLDTSSSRPEAGSPEQSPPWTAATNTDSISSLRDTTTGAPGHASTCGCRVPADSGNGGGDAVVDVALAPHDGSESSLRPRSSAHSHVTASMASSSDVSVSAALHDKSSLEHSIASTWPNAAAASHAMGALFTDASRATSPRPLAAATPPPLPPASPPPTSGGAAAAFKFRSVLASSERFGRGARGLSHDLSTSSEYAEAADSPETDGTLRRARGARRSSCGSPSGDFTTPLQRNARSPSAGGIRIGRESLTAKHKRRSHDRLAVNRQYTQRGSRTSRRDEVGAGSPTAAGGRHEPWVGLQLPRAVITPGLSFTKPAVGQGLHMNARRSGHEIGSGVLRRTNSDVCFGTFSASTYSFRSSVEERLSSFYNGTGGSASPAPQSIDAELPANVAVRAPSSLSRGSSSGSALSPRSRSRAWQLPQQQQQQQQQRGGASWLYTERGRSSGNEQAEPFHIT